MNQNPQKLSLEMSIIQSHCVISFESEKKNFFATIGFKTYYLDGGLKMDFLVVLTILMLFVKIFASNL